MRAVQETTSGRVPKCRQRARCASDSILEVLKARAEASAGV
jgi:hypothetical protein